MPRWASRITLEIVNVRVERVQEISEEDAIAEGCKPYIDPFEETQITSAVNSYVQLWDHLNAKRGYPWESNPWVWVVEFRRLEQPKPEEGG